MAWSCIPLLVALALVALTGASPLPASGRPGEHPVDDAPAAASSFDRSRRAPGPLALADPILPPIHTRSGRRPHAPKAAVTADSYRLPTTLRPTTYNIIITPNLTDFTFYGQVQIFFNAIEATDKIVLHAKELKMAMDDLSVSEDAGEALQDYANVVNMTPDKEREWITLMLDRPFVAGKRYALNIFAYTGVLNDDLDGFYRSSYKTSTGETRWLATTQFEPTGARRAFPCWDEPSFKARFNLVIKREKNLYAIANMRRTDSQPDEAETELIQDTFEATLPMSTYLVAFIVSDFKNATNAESNFTTWSRPDLIGGAAESQQIGPQALKLLAEFNGVDYSLPKMDQVAVPDFAAGAMENWGLVTYKESYLMQDADTTVLLVERIATVICHEFGHQWTGDLVTLDWWSHTWLNEGFASFYENFICSQIKPDWNLEDKMLPGFYHKAMESDVRETQVAMSSPVLTNAEIEDHFGVISYQKGGSVLRMFYHVLTPEVFKKGMKRYLSANMFKNTNPEHLFRAFNAEAELSNLHQLPAGVTFSEVASTWTEQPGVPVLSVSRDYAGGKVTLTQTRFLYAPASDPSRVAQKWWIPVVMTSQAAPDFTTTLPQAWLSPNVSHATLPAGASADQWVLVNPEQTGYFRVQYDTANWKMLAAALAANPSAFPPATRSQLLNDALALARAGQLDYAIGLDLLKAWRAERSVAAWQTAITALNYLLARLDTTGANDNLMTLIRDITKDAFDSVGYVVQASETHEAALLRYYIAPYTCHAGNAQCLDAAAVALKAWLADTAKNTSLHPDTRTTSLCYGVRGSDAATFEAMKKVWRATPQDDKNKYTYASALFCSKDQSLIKNLLSDALSTNYASSEGIELFNAVYDRLENHQLLMEFVKENADSMAAKFGNNFDVQVIAGLIRDIRTRDELSEVRTWVEAKYKNSGAWSALDDAFTSTENELKSWYDKYYMTVVTWLDDDQTTTAAPSDGSSTPSSGSSTPKPNGAAHTSASGVGVLLIALLCTALRV